MIISEIFGKNIFQGEGPFIGHPATFIRLFGCIKPYCEFCDTKYSWKENSSYKNISINNIINKIKKFNNKLIIITGGEPYVQEEIYELIEKLLKLNYDVQIETSGKAKIKKVIFNEVIIMSPKQYNGEFIINDKATLAYAEYYKFVAENEDEINNILTFIKINKINKDKCYIMAKGATRQQQIEISKKIFPLVSKHQLKYSPRLHVLMYDNIRGV
jgi:7-carboxy-7-deazaguanine synthase